MPKKATPASDFGRRLMRIRMERELTQIQLAEMIGSNQRNISHYETVVEIPPGPVIVKLAKALKVSADELLGLKLPKKAPPQAPQDPETKRLWKKFQAVRELPERDRRAVIRLINSLVAAKKAS